MPASRSPSELSAHQMGLSLAGTSRLKEEPIHSIPGTSALAIELTRTALYLRSCALAQVRTSGQQQETTREPGIHDGTIPIVQRVDGHPPQGDLKLYDRMLLRKYSVSGNESMPSDCSSLASVAPFSPPVESTKKRRRFYKKANLGREMRKKLVKFRRALPADFRPRSQSHLFELSRRFLILL